MMKPFKVPSRVPSTGAPSTIHTGPPPAKKRRISHDDEDADEVKAEVTAAAADVLKKPAPPPTAKKFVPLQPRKPLLPLSSNGSSASSQGASSQSEKKAEDDKQCIYYFCTWRKPTGKKHKTWDGDGVVTVRGSRVKLQNDDGKPMGEAVCKGPLMIGSEAFVGNKEIEIGEMIAREDYMAGRPFIGKNKSAPPAPSLKEINGTKNVTKKEQEKHNKLVSTQKDQVNNQVSKSARTQKPFQSVVSADYQPADVNLEVPTPRHSVDAENALIMRRPNSVPKGKQIVDVVIDPILSQKLRKHQREGVAFLYECVMGMKDYDGEGAILADEMGLGKTLQTITLVWTLLKQNPIHKDFPVVTKALIVCPVTLVKNWQKEFRKWLGDYRCGVFVAGDGNSSMAPFTQRGSAYPVMIIGYERLTKVKEQLKKCPIDLIICDEGHRLKTAKNKAAAAIKEIGTQRRVILSGTPIQNDLEEFYQMVDFVNPSIMSKYSTFKREFETPILRMRQPEASDNDIEKGQARSAELASRTGMFILRRTSEILSQYLPAKTEYVVLCRPTKVQADIYRTMVGTQAFVAAMNTPTAVLELINVLKKVCNCPKLLLTNDSKEDKITKPELLEGIPPRLLKSPGASGKLQVLDELLHQINSTTDEKVVLISNYTSTMDILGNLLDSMSYKYIRLDGTTPKNKRQDLVDRFNRSPKSNSFVFLLSAKAGGVGLNLIGASRLVMFDLDWNPSTDLQAMARIHRDGQTRPCYIYRLLTQGALDEKIFQRQISKTGLADAIVDGKSAASGFTQAELRDLFTLDEGDDCQTHRLLGCDCGGNGMPVRGPDDDAEGTDRNDLSALAGDDAPEVIRMDDSDDDDVVIRSRRITSTAADMLKDPASAGYGPDGIRPAVTSGKMLSLMQYKHFDTALVEQKSGVGPGLMGAGEEEEGDVSTVSIAEVAVEDDALRKVICDGSRRVGFVFTKLSS